MNDKVLNKLEAFFGQWPLKKLSKEELLFRAGEEPRGIYYLVSGQVKQYDISDQGNELVVNVFKPPAFFPTSWALNRTPNQYFFEAVTNITYRLAPADDVVEFLKDHPDATFDLLSRVYIGTDGLLRRMAHLMGSSAKIRLTYELVTEAKRFGKKLADGSHTIPIREDKLANRAGLSRETVSRELAKLKAAGLVSVGRQGIKISDLGKLETILGE